MTTKKTEQQQETEQKNQEHQDKVNNPVETEAAYHQEHVAGETPSQTATPNEDNEITVNVNSTNEADKDPSKEVPTSVHTEGTQGVQGIAAGSSTNKIVPTGNEGGASLITPDQQSGDEAPENKDIRELQPSAQEEQAQQDEQDQPRDFSLEVDGNKDEELTLREACDKAIEKLSSGSSSAILYRNDERFATFVTEEANGQKHVSIKPEDGQISDQEADVLNSYNLRVLTTSGS